MLIKIKIQAIPTDAMSNLNFPKHFSTGAINNWQDFGATGMGVEEYAISKIYRLIGINIQQVKRKDGLVQGLKSSNMSAVAN